MPNHWPFDRRLDPVLAIVTGLVAAGSRINREEREKGRNMSETVDVFKRRLGIWWAGEVAK